MMETVDDLHGVTYPADAGLDQRSTALAPAHLVQSLRLEMADRARRGAGPRICLLVMIHQRLPMGGTGALDGSPDVSRSEGHMRVASSPPAPLRRCGWIGNE